MLYYQPYLNIIRLFTGSDIGLYPYYSALDRGNEAFDDGVNLRFPSGTALSWGNRDYDINLLVADKTWDGDGQLRFSHNAEGGHSGFLGDQILTNWLYHPYFDVRARSYRFRILNGAVSRIFAFALAQEVQGDTGEIPGPAGSGVSYNRVPFYMIANDGNILEHTVPFDGSIDLDNDGDLLDHKGQLPSQGIAERYDIVVDFSKNGVKPGDKLYFVNTMEHENGKVTKRKVPLTEILSGAYKPEAVDDDGDGVLDRWINGDPGVGKFLEFRVQEYEGQDQSMNPADYVAGKKTMIPLTIDRNDPNLANAPHHTFEFVRSDGGSETPWKIRVDGGDKFPMDPHRISALMRGETEVWNLEGNKGWTHPTHIHFEEGVILKRGGKEPPEWEKWARKDLYRLGPEEDSDESVEVALRAREFVGTFVGHCHNTMHEDHAMLMRWDTRHPDEVVMAPTPMPKWDGVEFEDSFTLFSLPPAPDTTPPVITILGDNPATVNVGETYNDAGATAIDNIDHEVNVAVSGLPIDTSTTGIFNVIYSATDTAGNIATSTRTVFVVSPNTGKNSPPIVAPIPVQNVVVGNLISFKVMAVDPDHDALTFLLGADAPKGAVIDPATGVFSWTPSATSTFNFNIFVFDGVNAPVATGRLIESRDLGMDKRFGTSDDVFLGGMATWGVVKAQARDILGIQLDDLDALNAPLLATDLYGNFLRGPHGFPQLVIPGNSANDSSVLIEGNPLAPVDASLAIRTGQPFLADIAHNASPVNSRGAALPADSDNVIGLSEPGAYDNELLDAHYIAGDGRVNENIGLTSVHQIFHSEHNRLVEYIKKVILETGNPDFLNEWLMPGSSASVFPITQEEIASLSWNGERLFQTARFITETQYQHLAFEEFARKIQPEINPFSGYHTEIDPAIVAEFAHTVYRFGHTIINDTIKRVNADGTNNDISLIQAFLNPLAFTPNGTTKEQAVGSIVRGTTRQTANEIDEFVAESVRNNLLGLPLDLAAINIARGRDTGIPSLNAARRQFFAATGGNSALKPYTSWADFGRNIRHPGSLINFIAAYGAHPSITSVTTTKDKRLAATLLVLGGENSPSDRYDFLNSQGVWANDSSGITTTGLDNVDFWIGGLAEAPSPFGGLLGPTFNFVFENQMEKLQDGDRFYYLSRTAGLNLHTQLEENSFVNLIMRNTDLGTPDATHLPADIFSKPNYILEVDQTKQFNEGLGNADPVSSNNSTPLVLRRPNLLQFNGDKVHIVLGGSDLADTLIAGNGNDTVWGDGGNDRIEGGDGDDTLLGGAGDDIITDKFGVDNIKGGEGNDVINSGPGAGDLVFGGSGNDFVVSGNDSKEIFGGIGNDFLIGGNAADSILGNEGDDWIQGGAGADDLKGDNNNPFQNSSIIGNDVLTGDGGDDDYDGESGDDIMLAGPGIDIFEGMLGFDWVSYEKDPQPAEADMFNKVFQAPSVNALSDRFDSVEGLSGGKLNDILRGDDRDSSSLSAMEETSRFNNALNNSEQISLINGLQSLLGNGLTSFSGGNIILGGAGSDTIEGRGGNDLIDGDAYLNTRLSVREAANPNAEILSTDSLIELQEAMFSGAINPSQIVIVREILVPDNTSNDIDTAVFSGNRSDYTIGAPDASGVITVIDNRKDNDGIDTLRNIERLRFADETVELGASNAVMVPVLNGIVPVPVLKNPLSEGGLTIVKSDLDFILGSRLDNIC